MNKITFVCCPKPFLPEFYDIQHNAIMSWTKLKSVDKIIICGNDEGVEEYVDFLMKTADRKSSEIIYKKHIKVSDFGTPYVDELFNIAADETEKYACYINSDIILLSDFDDTFNAFCDYNDNVAHKKDFLLMGTRWNWKNPKSIDFTDANWESIVTNIAKNDGSMHAPTGIDYFVYSKTTFPNMHPFSLGKMWWDNWIVGNAFRRPNVTTIDVSKSVFAIHQNSPWFSSGDIHTSMKVFGMGVECQRNKAFDPYLRHIATGTNEVSYLDSDGRIMFRKK